MGQFPYKKYEQLQKQREKANRYMQQSKENYQKSRYYSYEVYKPGNTAAQRSKNLEKAQSYYEKQANQFMKAYQKANEYQRELLKPKPPKEVKPSQYERPKLPRFKNPYQTYSIYNPYQYPQGQSYERLEEKGGLAGYKSFYD